MHAYPLSRFCFFTLSLFLVPIRYSLLLAFVLRLNFNIFNNLFRVTYRKIKIHAIDLSTVFLSHLHCNISIWNANWMVYALQTIDWKRKQRERRKGCKWKFKVWAYEQLSIQLSSQTCSIWKFFRNCNRVCILVIFTALIVQCNWNKDSK